MTSSLFNGNVRGNPYRIRDPHNSILTEIWLVSAIVSVLLIRLYLYLTGYPQVGGETLHIAHMLWGGLGMVVSFALVILFAHPVWKPIAALVGGVGFGAFIDELGKFITKDNDYFYEPTVALMYGIFIILFFLARYFDRKREPTEADHLYLAVQGIQWQAIGKLDRHRQEAALGHLEASGNRSALAGHLRQILQNAEIAEDAGRSRIVALREKGAALYWSVVGHKWMRRVIVGLFIIRALQILGAVIIGMVSDTFIFTDGLSISEWLAMAAGGVSGGLALYGVVRIFQRRRVDAIQALAGSALVSLLFGQFFAFASVQFVALGGLVLDLGALGALRLALAAESERHEREDGEAEDDPRQGLGQFL